MNKNPINKTILSKTIRTTQAIEGYKEADKQTVLKAQSLREKYGYNGLKKQDKKYID